jgi:hypothetical protein
MVVKYFASINYLFCLLISNMLLFKTTSKLKMPLQKKIVYMVYGIWFIVYFSNWNSPIEDSNSTSMTSANEHIATFVQVNT